MSNGSIGPDATLDTLQCPSSYDLTLGDRSRYRLTTTAGEAWAQSDACALDTTAATHLVVLNDSAEFTGVQSLIDNSRTLLMDGVWVGGVQLRTATSPGDEWIGFDGLRLINGPWYDAVTNGVPDQEPNDGNRTEDGQEQFVIIRPTDSQAIQNGLQDSGGGNSKRALCECDGNPLDPTAKAEIDYYHHAGSASVNSR